MYYLCNILYYFTILNSMYLLFLKFCLNLIRIINQYCLELHLLAESQFFNNCDKYYFIYEDSAACNTLIQIYYYIEVIFS